MVYLEEYIYENEFFKSVGVILVQQLLSTEENKHLSYFKKKLRIILEQKMQFEEILKKINPQFKYERWGAIEDDELNKLKICLDATD